MRQSCRWWRLYNLYFMWGILLYMTGSVGLLLLLFKFLGHKLLKMWCFNHVLVSLYSARKNIKSSPSQKKKSFRFCPHHLVLVSLNTHSNHSNNSLLEVNFPNTLYFPVSQTCLQWARHLNQKESLHEMQTAVPCLSTEAPSGKQCHWWKSSLCHGQVRWGPLSKYRSHLLHLIQMCHYAQWATEAILSVLLEVVHKFTG